MALPSPSTPIYTLTLPTNKKRVKYKPWNGRMEKALQVALIDDDKATIKNTVQSVIDECTFNTLDVPKLSDVDTDWIITQLRSKSVGEIVELTTNCTNCEKPYDIGVNLSDAVVVDVLGDKRNNNIKIDDTISFKMKLPTKDAVWDYINDAEATKDDLLVTMIESIYTNDVVENPQNYSKQELIDYIDSFNKQSLMEVYQYIDNLPRVVTTTKAKCRHCKTEHTLRLEGSDFFLN